MSETNPTQAPPPLLPCPFCGGFAYETDRDEDGFYTVSCGECSAEAGFSKSNAKAIAAWNHRAPKPPAPEVITDGPPVHTRLDGRQHVKANELIASPATQRQLDRFKKAKSEPQAPSEGTCKKHQHRNPETQWRHREQPDCVDFRLEPQAPGAGDTDGFLQPTTTVRPSCYLCGKAIPKYEVHTVCTSCIVNTATPPQAPTVPQQGTTWEEDVERQSRCPICGRKTCRGHKP